MVLEEFDAVRHMTYNRGKGEDANAADTEGHDSAPQANFQDICSAVMRNGVSCFFARFPQQFHQGSTLYICPHALTEAYPIGLRLRLDLLGLHGKMGLSISRVTTALIRSIAMWKRILRSVFPYTQRSLRKASSSSF